MIFVRHEQKVSESVRQRLLRWVDGQMGGPRGAGPPPRLRSERGGTCAQHVHLYNGTLLQVCHFHVRPFSGNPTQNIEIHCHFALWALFEVPAPFRAQPLTAWCIGPFVRTSPNRSGLNDWGGPHLPIRQLVEATFGKFRNGVEQKIKTNKNKK